MSTQFVADKVYEEQQQKLAERAILKRFNPLIVERIRWTSIDEDITGTDCVVCLTDGSTVNLDFKFRRPSKTGEVFDDIALEYRHEYDDGTRKKGWVAKDTTADWVVYCVPSADVWHWLPSWRLRLAWEANKTQWIESSFTDESPIVRRRCYKNDTYVSVNLCVPKEILREAMEGVTV